ncbi:MAG: hypothetical protein HZC42_04965 [Candidatus Eisenbacteria bacterium]|nr:hypothetical protein [Candidatus Eisenbacteria bacterium]
MYGKVCEALGNDDFTFTYGKSEEQEKPPEARGFGLRLLRPEGRGGLEIKVENPSLAVPIRLFIGYTWPPSLASAKEGFDLAAGAVFNSLQGNWTKFIAEARIRAECAVSGPDALGFLTGEMLGKAAGWIDSLGKPLSFCSVKFEVEPLPTTEALATPKRDLMIEVLREDRTKLYLELVSQWPQVAMSGAVDLNKLRPIDRHPSDYIEETRSYLARRLEEFEPRGGQSR